MSIPIELIHFNDVYHVAPSKDEPIGGASRFTTLINQIRSESELEPLVLFSGDAFNPSLEGTITRGSHMPAILNQFKIDAACLGNHDFDFGMPQLEKLMGQTNFPWLLSNVLNSGETAHETIHRYLILEQNGLRIGLIGLVEKEWIQTIPSFPSDLTYYDHIQIAKDLSRELRDPEGPHHVDLIIALTHMRVPNDIKLARSCKNEIDLVLGGHDHFYYVSKAVEIEGDQWTREQNLNDVGHDPEEEEGEDVFVVKSGTDFREFSYLKIQVDTNEETGKKYMQSVSAKREVIDSSIEPDEATEELVNEVSKLVSARTSEPIGYTTEPLDGRSMAVRTEETNFGNFTADLMMMYYKSIETPAEIGFCVGGTIRNDSIIEVGEITLGDIMTAFPFLDPVVVIRVTGQQIWDALENSVSEYPKQEGRFPQLSGLRLEWNPDGPPGNRVRNVYTVKQRGLFNLKKANHRRSLGFPNRLTRTGKYDPENMDELDLEREYIVATRNYLIGGYDGYTAFKVPEDKIVVDEEMGVLVSTLYRKYFLGLKYINAFREYQAKNAHHEDRIKKLVETAASHWRKVAMQFKRHNHPEDGRDCDCETSSQDETAFLESDIKERAGYHVSRQGIQEAFIDSSRGHPVCIESEDVDPKGEKNNREDEDSWVKRWASICPVVEGRIVRVDY